MSNVALDDTSIRHGPVAGNVRNPTAGRRTDVPDPNGCDNTWLLQTSATAGVTSVELTRIATCCPCVPSKE